MTINCVAETRMHPRGGAAVCVRGAPGGGALPLSPQLHEVWDASLWSDNDILEQLRSNRV